MCEDPRNSYLFIAHAHTCQHGVDALVRSLTRVDSSILQSEAEVAQSVVLVTRTLDPAQHLASVGRPVWQSIEFPDDLGVRVTTRLKMAVKIELVSNANGLCVVRLNGFEVSVRNMFDEN